MIIFFKENDEKLLNNINNFGNIEENESPIQEIPQNIDIVKIQEIPQNDDIQRPIAVPTPLINQKIN